jgi:hypothetical protein
MGSDNSEEKETSSMSKSKEIVFLKSHAYSKKYNANTCKNTQFEF